MASATHLKKMLQKIVEDEKKIKSAYLDAVDNLCYPSLRAFLERCTGDGILLEMINGSSGHFIKAGGIGLERSDFSDFLLRDPRWNDDAVYGIWDVYSKRYKLYSEYNLSLSVNVILSVDIKLNTVVRVDFNRPFMSVLTCLMPCYYDIDLIKDSVKNVMPNMISSHYSAKYDKDGRFKR